MRCEECGQVGESKQPVPDPEATAYFHCWTCGRYVGHTRATPVEIRMWCVEPDRFTGVKEEE